MDSRASHKGSWCWVDRGIFCQEGYCDNCVILWRDWREFLNDRHCNPSNNNSMPSGDTCLHSISNQKE